ncbi:MAG TPA: phosphodiester glycosidase family protein [Thermoanaerobaculia bacterium]
MRLLATVLLLALTACARVADDAPEEKKQDPEWKPVAPIACVNDWTPAGDGVEYRMLDCTPEEFALHLVRVDPKKVKLEAVVRSDSDARTVAGDGAFGINANFFDTEGKALGVVTSGGRELNAMHNVSWQSVFYVDKNGKPGIVRAPEWKQHRDDAVFGVQAGPRLVIGGRKNEVARARGDLRAGVCIDKAERVIFFATPHESLFDVWQMVDLAATKLDCQDAMLFDGGPSVQLYLQRQPQPVFVEGDRRVPVYVVGRP